VVESQAVTRAPAAFAATDLLHRRIQLPYRFQLGLERSNVLVKTDSPLMWRVLRSSAESSGLIAESGVAVWEIAVEVQNEATSSLSVEMTDSFDAYSFGPSRSLRMSSGSWFAYTPPSLNGVGFAIVSGDECCQVRQLLAFFERIKFSIGEGEPESNSLVEREVLA
jgi:hypothetical protein